MNLASSSIQPHPAKKARKTPELSPVGVAYSYIRFSTPEQLKGDSLRRQTERSEQYAKEHNLRLDQSLRLQDLGISAYHGRNSTDGALASFLAAIQSGRVAPGSTLLVESLDRLSRSQITNALTQFLGIINAGITVVTLMDGMIYNTYSVNSNPGALLMSIVIMMRAHEESATKSDRLRGAWGAKRRKAQENKTPLTNRCPAWLVLKDGEYQVIEDRAALIRRIFKLTAEGLGKRSVAKILNSDGIPTWGDGIHQSRRSNGWRDSYIQKLIHTQAVLGVFQPHQIDKDTGKRVTQGEPIPGYFPTIISPDLWHAVHSRPTAPTGPRPVNIGNLFSGLVVDGYTGQRMVFRNHASRQSARSRGDGRFLVSDVGRLKPETKPQRWPYWHFEGKVLHFLRELDWESLVSPERDPEEVKFRAEEARLNLEVSRLNEGINRLLESFATGDQPSTLAKAAQAHAAELAKALESAEARLKEVREVLFKRQSQAKAVGEEIEEFKRLIAEGSQHERLRLQTEIRRRVSRIVCYRYGVPYDLRKPGPVTPDDCTGAPSLQIDFHNGTHRFVIFPSNSLHKERTYNQPRNPKTGAYISRNSKL